MHPAKPVAGERTHWTVGVTVPISATDNEILEKAYLAKEQYNQLRHKVDLDGGDLGGPNL